MSNLSEDLVHIGTGPDGILFTDGEKLYMVWPSDEKGFSWSGLEVVSPSMAFPGIDGDEYCGGEVDMRQHEEDPMTEETMALGDRVADFISKHINQERRMAYQRWKNYPRKD